ncbi:MAG: hypothetical protein AAB131_24315, partial [Actinomycetota bacterium]
ARGKAAATAATRTKAIGSPAGGHTMVAPELGTLDDFTHFVDEARRLGLEVALDLAFQCSPDHPYVRSHPEWFARRPDGTVRNGNRRLAMLKRLQREEGIEGFEYVDVVVLDPEDIDEVALFDMEQREQLTENLKVRYTDINLLLAIRAAAESRSIDWFDPGSIDRVAGELQHVIGNNKGYAAVQLNAIRYMDAYLESSEQPGEYHKLIGQIERFRDVGKVMAKLEADYEDDVPAMLRVLFAAIRAGAPHGDIRILRNLFLHDRDRYEQLLGEVDGIEADWEGTGADALADPEVVDLAPAVDDDDTDELEEPPGPNVPNYPRGDIRDAIDNAIDGFESSMTDDVAKTLRQILNRLQVLSDTGGKLDQALAGDQADKVRAALSEVISWADRHRDLLR